MYNPQIPLNSMSYASTACPSFGAQSPAMTKWLNQGTTSGVYPAHRASKTVGAAGTAGGILGLSLPTLLFLVFLALKLTHVIDWSWWWVTSPLWIGFALALVLLLLGGLFGAGLFMLGQR